MRPHLRSIDQAPRALPIWHAILADLGDPEPRRIAKTLGVSLRTVYRWNAAQEAPKCAAMALFWLTRWGQSQVNCQAINDAVLACSYVEALQSEVKTLRVQVDKLARLNRHGAANGPLMRLPL